MTEIARINGAEVIKAEPLRPRDTGNSIRGGSDYEYEWSRCVESARKRLLEINRNRMEISRLCLEVCDVQNGGGSHWNNFEGVKTIRQFAEDIGMAYKTLQTWCRVRMYVVDRLDGIFDERNYSAATRTLSKIENIGSRDASREKVKDIYENELKRVGSKYEIYQANKSLRTIKNKVVSQLDIKSCDQQELIEIKEYAEDIISFIDKNIHEIEVEKEINEEDLIYLNDTVGISIEELLKTRMLIQANSGGGKSHSIKRICQQLKGRLKTIILDPEGEYDDLNETEYFEVLDEEECGGELAQYFLNEDVSCVVKMDEMDIEERETFVSDFLESMLGASKECWQECLVIIDEAQMFAPNNVKSDSLSSMINFATRGRKRGFSLIVATQRLSTLNKSVAAECLNKMIGRTSLDIDIRRSAKELCLPNNTKTINKLRNLTPGEFYCFGPAISNYVQKTKVGELIIEQDDVDI